MVLDEPLSGLDTFGVRRMQRLLKRLAQEGITLLLSSHRLREMESVVHHTGILFRGKLVHTGPLGELAATQSTLRIRVKAPEVCEQFFNTELGIESWERVEADFEQGASFRVRLNGAKPEEINRKLVQKGVDVCELAFEKGSLDRFFDELMAREEARHAPEGKGRGEID